MKKTSTAKNVIRKNSIKTSSGLTVKVAHKCATRKRLVAGGVITKEDADMDKKAKEAISAAIKKSKVLAKPIAVYDKDSHKTYLEYSDGKRKEIKK